MMAKENPQCRLRAGNGGIHLLNGIIPQIRDSLNEGGIPAELKAFHQWVCFGARKNKQGELIQKMPIDPKTGRNAHSNYSDTWGTLQQAVDGVNRISDATGIGFMFSEQDPFAGIDLDKCRNPITREIELWAQDVVRRMNTYTEVSLSGSGLHIIFKGKLPEGARNRSGCVEVYDKGRYFVMTGTHLQGTPATIECRQEELLAWHREVFKPIAPVKRTPSVGFLGSSDADLIRRIESSEQGAKFIRLWQGDASDYNDDASAADLALCAILRFWTQADGARMDSLFRQSGLMRDKWNEKHGDQTYGQMTIQAALPGETYSPDVHLGKVTVGLPYQRAMEIKEEWPEPEEIKSNILLPVTPLSPEIIPEPLLNWCGDIARRMQCPLEFTVIGALVALSSLIGAGCGIRPKQQDDWEIVPNLWGGIVARPSQLKTPALSEVLKPIKKLEAAAREEYVQCNTMYQAKCESHKAQRESIKSEMIKKAKENKPLGELEIQLAALTQADEPGRRRFITNDTTVEKLGELLQHNPRGILSFRDELVGLLAYLDREDRQSDRAFYLEGWNGNMPYTADRIGRGTIDTANVCLSVLGGIQPAKLTGYLLQAVGSLSNDGLMQRFQLLIYPDEPQGWKLIDEAPNAEARDAAYKIFETLADMDFMQEGAIQGLNDDRPYFRFDAGGQEIFNAWLTEHQAKLENPDEHALMTEHLAKYRKLVPALALVFHLVEIARGRKQKFVSALSVGMAADFAEFLETHARRIYGLLFNLRPQSAAALAKKIKSGAIVDADGKMKEHFTTRDIYRQCWQLLDTPELVQAACDELIEAGWLQKQFSKTIGRTGTQYRINPKVIS